ncbi:PREDICTED: uncharacterized protein LOC104809405 [Tarenaya hassleriana]|uniref:uncharacterized protein LOC104809405 n=1 Tax=Tarenaya hassleriana TaxID=28532 RepID=UPI00053C5D47|nr:PREDICTED: uncharacterized protein LOC104809405 [Tarenaya hassleriana]
MTIIVKLWLFCWNINISLGGKIPKVTMPNVEQLVARDAKGSLGRIVINIFQFKDGTDRCKDAQESVVNGSPVSEEFKLQEDRKHDDFLRLEHIKGLSSTSDMLTDTQQKGPKTLTSAPGELEIVLAVGFVET